MLEIEGLDKHFGGVAAANGITLTVHRGELVSVIGPNGSGKTTLFNLITGLISPDRGSIRLEGQEIAGLPPYAIVARGVARTFQNIRLFNNLSVMENLLVGEHARLQAGVLGAIVRPPSVRQEERRDLTLRYQSFSVDSAPGQKLVVFQAADLDAVQRVAATGREVEAADGVHQRGLAGA